MLLFFLVEESNRTAHAILFIVCGICRAQEVKPGTFQYFNFFRTVVIHLANSITANYVGKMVIAATVCSVLDYTFNIKLYRLST